MQSSGREGLQNSIIIPRGENIPCSITESFYTVHDNQTGVDLKITQSAHEETDPSFVAIIWEGELKLPSGRPAQQELKFTYSYTEDGRMKCSFLDIESGEDTEIDLDMARKASDSTSTDIDKFKVE